MAYIHYFLLWALLSTIFTICESCFCENYPWSTWSSCSKSCNYGTQSRSRKIIYDEYYHKYGCDQFCTKHEWRACNEKACPINCQIGDFGPWSECDPCIEKQFRVRSLLLPSQFGGQGCTDELVDSRKCIPSKLCNLEMDCKNKFRCYTGRCIARDLECNGQNDCGDNSDESSCKTKKILCTRQESIPSVQLLASGYNLLSRMSRGEVLDNSFYGEKCRTVKSNRTRVFRVPENLHNITFQGENKEDDVHSNFFSNLADLDFGRVRDGIRTGSSSSSYGIPILWGSNSDTSTISVSSMREAIKASHKKDSNFIRIHKEISVADFTMKESDLRLSDVFLKSLNHLPLEYNYALYSRIFDDFGTHYFTSGSMGGTYDLLYQFSVEQLKASGLSTEQSLECAKTETRERYLIFFTRTTVRSKCVYKSSSTSSEGSFLQSSETSISLVKGGRTEYAAALAWKKDGAFPESNIFAEWLASAKDNPVVLSFKLAPILDLVKGIPCALTKRRNLKKALNEYIEKFDPCKCAPCPNNGRPILSGTECLCVCQSGTFGDNCEKRAPDYSSVAVDGYWSCWSAWSPCDASFKRRRTRTCNNPSPLNGGKACEGEQEQDEDCHFSIFIDKGALCIDDDEGKKEEEGVDTKPTTGCAKPTPPDNGFFMNDKKHYSVAEQVEIACYSGYERVGYQYFRCLSDGSWKQQDIVCRTMVCSRPSVSESVSIVPYKMDYKIGDSIQMSCPPGLILNSQTRYTCGKELSWKPPIFGQITCEEEIHKPSDSGCNPGQKKIGSECVCMSPAMDCGRYSEDLCVFDAVSENYFTQSRCQYLAEKCLGEKQLYFLQSGACQDINLNWVIDRIELSSNSTKAETCGYDKCYDWERCSGELSQCLCLLPYQCPPPKDESQLFCVKAGSSGRMKTADLCSLGAMKCAKIKAVILHDGKCSA